MKTGRILSILFASAVLFSLAMPAFAQAQGADHNAAPTGTPPLKLVGTFEFPSDEGIFDHLLADIPGHRLFTTPRGHKSVKVFDLQTRKLIHTIEGVEIPHTLLYRQDLNRLYVTDGGPGELKIFDGKTYELINSVKLQVDADPFVFDPVTKYLYVVSGGRDAKLSYSTMSIIDTTSGEKLDEMKIDGNALDAMVIEASSPKLYLDNVGKNQVDVIDRKSRTLMASWPITLAERGCVTITLDEAHHRLFVGCRSGQLVVFDTQAGKELQVLPINQGIDDLVYDPASKRLYAACPAGAGSVDIFEQTDADHYKPIAQVPTGPGARNGRLEPELKRYFSAVPQHESTNAKVLEFEVQ
jgi:DNA-binding beta-propeller fold protein YncE